MQELILGLSILFFWSMCIFMPVSHCFDYHRFVIQSEVRKCDASFVLSQECFGSSVSFVVPYTF